MAAADLISCSVPPGYICYAELFDRVSAFPGWFQLLLQFLPQDHIVFPPESRTPGFEWSEVSGTRGPGYWFQHDGSSAHCNVIREYLDETYGNRWIGRGGPITWALAILRSWKTPHSWKKRKSKIISSQTIY
jgi:hypothetical protein